MLQKKSVFLILLFGVLGCGPGYGNLEGKVKLGDKPLASGTVIAVGSDGIVKQSLIGEDGSYNISRVIASKVKISVSSPDPDASRPKSREKGPGKEKEKFKSIDKSKWFPIPDDYGDPERSGLTFDVKASQKNQFDINLTKK
jgi:hypothetical protein